MLSIIITLLIPILYSVHHEHSTFMYVSIVNLSLLNVLRPFSIAPYILALLFFTIRHSGFGALSQCD